MDFPGLISLGCWCESAHWWRFERRFCLATSFHIYCWSIVHFGMFGAISCVWNLMRSASARDEERTGLLSLCQIAVGSSTSWQHDHGKWQGFIDTSSVNGQFSSISTAVLNSWKVDGVWHVPLQKSSSRKYASHFVTHTTWFPISWMVSSRCWKSSSQN